MAFPGKAEPTKRRRNRDIENNSDRLVKFEKRPHTEMEPNLSFLQKQSLRLEYHPFHRFESFVPISNSKQRNELTTENYFSWTKNRAMMWNENIGVSMVVLLT